jgi:hypothetical protein
VKEARVSLLASTPVAGSLRWIRRELIECSESKDTEFVNIAKRITKRGCFKDKRMRMLHKKGLRKAEERKRKDEQKGSVKQFKRERF